MSNLTAKDLYGGMTALVTPMLMDGRVDYVRWQELIQWQIKAQIRAIIVAGTTGESALLSLDEFQQLLTIAVECCKTTNTRVIAQTGHINTDAVIQSNNLAGEVGADAVLIVTPYYIRTTQLGLEQHFSKIADTSPLPVILYNVPTRTQNDMLAKTTASLANHKMIIGIKEAAVDKNRILELVRLLPKEFAILSGNDDTFLLSMQQGANGVISVASNVRPYAINQIATFMALGDVISAKKLNTSLANLYKMLSYQPNPIPVKFLLHAAGLIDAGIRLPLLWLEAKLTGSKAELVKIMNEIKTK
ncbi:4-hydroxy-tetrahydrodipicolinate synthase [hydrothermal vent metagenome]|uniref:4-hydroxy-tetrahydrodipicolinate synthase n=1 Tax=hydrothermal vent metagenome TaxID=652676 RepID=A0A3B0VT90_9ZZZZ